MRIGAAVLACVVLAACGRSGPAPAPARPPPPASAPVAAPASPPAALSPQTVDQAPFAPDAAASADRTPAVLRAQILLDRARFSPGVIDGRPGENLRQAVAAFEEAKGLPVDGQLDEQVFARLTQADSAPVLKSYLIDSNDTQRAFVTIPHDFKAQSQLPSMGYQSPRELLAEKFHMTEELLAELNPGVDFSEAGAAILVADVRDDELPSAVALVEVDKADRAIKAYDAQGQLMAFYPASIGSEERPAPTGVLKVTGVTHEPTYVFDPARLTFKPKGVDKRTTLPAGPNNPVGTVWIGLSKATYGIHGSDEPKEIGKTFSHGCIRMTNWDAEQLAGGVKPGVKVSFVEESAAGLRQAAARRAPKAGPASASGAARPVAEGMAAAVGH